MFPIQVPALRERADDIPGLVWHFVEQCSDGLGKRIETIAEESMRQLQQYGWPGNIRELRNVVERAMILADARDAHEQARSDKAENCVIGVQDR